MTPLPPQAQGLRVLGRKGMEIPDLPICSCPVLGSEVPLILQPPTVFASGATFVGTGPFRPPLPNRVAEGSGLSVFCHHIFTDLFIEMLKLLPDAEKAQSQ